MNRILTIAFLVALTACSTPAPQVTASPEATVTLPPATPTPEATATPQPQIAPEVQAKFDEVGAKLGEDENGNPIYFVTNPAGETVTIGKQNENGEWELTPATKYRVFETLEEAIASGEIVETEDALKGVPGYSAEIYAQPLPEDVFTDLNVVVITPNFQDPYNEQLDFDEEGKYLIEKNPDKAPYRLVGYFVFKNIYKGVEQPGHGMVWQWKKRNGKYVYITTLTTQYVDGYLDRPFVSFGFTKDVVNAPIINEIGHDPELMNLALQWAEEDDPPEELQDTASLVSVMFP